MVVPSGKFATDVGYLDKYLQAVESFRDEGIIMIRESGIFSKVVDPSESSMCVSKIQSTALNHVEVNDSDTVDIGLDFTRARDMLKSVSSTSEVEVDYPVNQKGTHKVRFSIPDEDLTLAINAIDTDHVPGIPDNKPLSHKTRIVVSGKELSKAFKHLGKVYDKDEGGVKFYTDSDKFVIESSDIVDGEVKKTFYASESAGSSDLGEHSVSIGWGFIDDIEKTIGKSSEVEIHIANDKPIRFDLSLDEAGDAKIIYLIAPRLDDK